MEQPSQTKMPKLSLVVPDRPNNPSQGAVGPSDKISQRRSQTPNQANDTISTKQKRLFPVACRLVSMDQWFTTRIDRTWNVLDLKIWLLSKALPKPLLPLPASYRPSSPVTFAAAPPPPPRPSTMAYHSPTSSTTLVSPITFAAPQSLLSTSTSPQTPGRHVFYPPLSSAEDTPSSPISSLTAVPSPASNPLPQEEEDVPLYANSYSTMLNNHFEDEDDEDDGGKMVRIASHSIPYSYNTGAPAISGLAALKSNTSKIISGRGYSASLSSVDMDLARQATSVASRWSVYSFSTGMLLSDDRPLTEYTIRPYELLELHRTGGYVSLPRTILPGLDPYSSSDNRDASSPPPPTTKTTFAYHATRHFGTHSPTPTRQSFPLHTQGDAGDSISSDSSDDEYDEMATGSPYAQPYFDGWVWVLRDGPSGPNGNCELGTHDGGGGDGLPGRKMRRRGRAKSEVAKSGRGKDRARMEREWKDMKQPLRKEGDAEVEPQASPDRWNKRWLVIREGIMTVWKEREDNFPEESYKISACAGLYGADRLPSVLAATSQSHTSFTKPLVANANPPHTSNSNCKPSSTSLSLSHHVICARFRQRSSPRGPRAARMHGKYSGKSHQHVGTWVVLKVAEATVHEHLLRIFHRLSYSSPVSSNYPATFSFSGTPSRALHTRTLRTDFIPNPIPHPLSLSFSTPSPIQQGDESPISPFDDFKTSDGEYDDERIDTGSVWGQSRGKATGKCTAGHVGLGGGVGVRYPEWREEVLHKAIRAGRGVTITESRGALDLSPQIRTSDPDQLHTFDSCEDLDNYAVNLAGDDCYSDNSDSDAFSEAEWESWAYDLDRPKVVDEVGTGPGRTRQPSRDGVNTLQGSPISDSELVAFSGSALNGANSPSTITSKPRAQSLSNNSNSNSPVRADVSTPSPSPTSASPTTPSARVRASTVSAQPHNSNSTVVQTTNVGASHSSVSSQLDYGVRGDMTATLRNLEPNTAGGVRSIMRGLSMRAGKESFLRQLENALDFVEGK